MNAWWANNENDYWRVLNFFILFCFICMQGWSHFGGEKWWQITARRCETLPFTLSEINVICISLSARGAKLHDEGDLRQRRSERNGEKVRWSGSKVVFVRWVGEGGTIPGSKVDLKQQKQRSVTFPLATLNNVHRPKLLTSLKPTEQRSASLQSGLVVVRGQIAEIIEVHIGEQCTAVSGDGWWGKSKTSEGANKKRIIWAAKNRWGRWRWREREMHFFFSPLLLPLRFGFF